jgi:hypothetical protein
VGSTAYPQPYVNSSVIEQQRDDIPTPPRDGLAIMIEWMRGHAFI